MVGSVVPLSCMRVEDGKMRIVCPEKTEPLFANYEMLTKSVDIQSNKEKIITFSIVMFYVQYMMNIDLRTIAKLCGGLVPFYRLNFQ